MIEIIFLGTVEAVFEIDGHSFTRTYLSGESETVEEIIPDKDDKSLIVFPDSSYAYVNNNQFVVDRE